MKNKKMLIIVFVALFICVAVISAVIIINNSNNADPETVYEEDVRTEPVSLHNTPGWVVAMGSANYALVEVGEQVFEESYDKYVYQLETNAEVKYKIYDFEMKYLYDGFSYTYDEKSEFLLFEGYDDLNLEKGDVLFICCYSTQHGGYECLAAEADESGNSFFIKLENGCADFNDDVLKKLIFSPISSMNCYAGNSDANNAYHVRLPDKKLYGSVTEKEIIRYFDAVKKARKNWIDSAET